MAIAGEAVNDKTARVAAGDKVENQRDEGEYGEEGAEVAAGARGGAVAVFFGEGGEVGAAVELLLELGDLRLGFVLAARRGGAGGTLVHEQDVRGADLVHAPGIAQSRPRRPRDPQPMP